MTRRTQQLLFVLGALILTLTLYLAPKKIEKMEAAGNPTAFSFENFITKAKQGLKRQEIEGLNVLENQAKENPNDVFLLDSLGKRWDALQRSGIAAHYFEIVAEEKKDEKSWINAAYRYFDAFQTTEDSAVRKKMTEKAIESYEKVLLINPKNLDAKTDLGVCYVEGTGEPMKGIMMLREVVTENPEHENAQFNLGVLSMKSGQYTKAAERFEKVLSINPARKEMYLMTGRAYMMAGNNEKAKENFERLKKESNNPELKGQADNYLKQISNH
jgi:tetratricopeptide (TPR) repeat protein